MQCFTLIQYIFYLKFSVQIDLSLKGNSIDTSSFVANGGWELVSAPAEQNVIKYDCCPEEYIDITFKITVKRRGSKYTQVLFFKYNMYMYHKF